MVAAAGGPGGGGRRAGRRARGRRQPHAGAAARPGVPPTRYIAALLPGRTKERSQVPVFELWFCASYTILHPFTTRTGCLQPLWTCRCALHGRSAVPLPDCFPANRPPGTVASFHATRFTRLTALYHKLCHAPAYRKAVRQVSSRADANAQKMVTPAYRRPSRSRGRREPGWAPLRWWRGRAPARPLTRRTAA